MPPTSLPTEVQNKIKSYMELTPGVDATRANLKTLLAYILWHGYWKIEDDLAVHIAGQNRKRVLALRVEGPRAPRSAYRPLLRTREFPPDEDGLLEALVYLKKVVQKYRTEGVCEACSDWADMRLKADGMPCCESCVITAAVGL